MSTWVEGRVYDYYGEQIRCVRRWFDGTLECVDLRFVAAEPEAPTWTRTARALAPCVYPEVTKTLGGVERPDWCNHYGYARVLADAGPHAGAACCAGCGSPASPSPVTRGERDRCGRCGGEGWHWDADIRSGKAKCFDCGGTGTRRGSNG